MMRPAGRTASATYLTPSLLAVFAAAKAIALAGHDVPLSWWSPIAYLWQDAAVTLAFAIVETCSPGAAGRLVYAALGSYVALNVPVTRVLSTPLTWPMWRAARGPLADSIGHYATWDNALLSSTVMALAVGLPFAFRRIRSIRLAPLVAALIAVAALGPAAVARVDTRGLERNAWAALVTTARPRVLARAPTDRWDRIGFEDRADTDLARFRGAAAGRHIVLVSLESTAAQYLGVYGAHPDVMPNLSALATQAIVFDHAYAVYPESIKGLFSVLCSAYPAFDRAAESHANVNCASIAGALGDRGYRTGLFHSGRFGYLGMDAVIRNRGYEVLADAGDIGGRHDSSFGVDEPSTVSRMLHWIDTLRAGDRFFLTYLPIAGHHPYDTPEAGPFPERDDWGRYRNALHYGDAALGTLMRGLRARGLQDKTLWIVFGDHGEAFGQHDGNYGHTFQIFEENVHVPLLVAAPGLIAQPLRRRQVASLIDTAPTILDLLGEPAPAAHQGQSLLDGAPRMAFFFADYSIGLLGLRDGRFKMMHEIDSGRTRLFDLAADPAENADISHRQPARSAWYARALRTWGAAQQRAVIQAQRSRGPAAHSMTESTGRPTSP